MPQGPENSTEEWYAGSRLAYCVLFFYVWGAAAVQMACPRGKWFSFYSRVMEKGCLYTLAAFKHLLSIIDLSTTSVLSTWSDVGKHFRGKRTLSAIGTKVVAEHHIDVMAQFGVPKHFKNNCGGAFIF